MKNSSKKNFSFEDMAYMLVMNVQCTDDSLKKVGELMRWK